MTNEDIEVTLQNIKLEIKQNLALLELLKHTVFNVWVVTMPSEYGNLPIAAYWSEDDADDKIASLADNSEMKKELQYRKDTGMKPLDPGPPQKFQVVVQGIWRLIELIKENE